MLSCHRPATGPYFQEPRPAGSIIKAWLISTLIPNIISAAIVATMIIMTMITLGEIPLGPAAGLSAHHPDRDRSPLLSSISTAGHDPCTIANRADHGHLVGGEQ